MEASHAAPGMFEVYAIKVVRCIIRIHFEKEMPQLTGEKCLRWASFLSKLQKTCPILKVADVTGSVKSTLCA
jgi:hypothetical protein